MKQIQLNFAVVRSFLFRYRLFSPIFLLVILSLTFSGIFGISDSLAQTGNSIALSNGKIILRVFLDGNNRLNQVQLVRDDGRVAAANGSYSPFNINLQNTADGRRVTLDNSNFSFEITNATATFATLSGTADFEGQQLRLKIFYNLSAAGNYAQSWLELAAAPNAAHWSIRYAAPQRWEIPRDMSAPTTLRDWYYLTKMLVPAGATPAPLITSNTSGLGLYLFDGNATGREYIDSSRRLATVDQYEFHSIGEKFVSGKAATGTYVGGAEIGSKEYVDYLAAEQSILNRDNKSTPFFYSTWLVDTADINETKVLNTLDKAGQLGIHDLLHIDAGWEGGSPLQPDPYKFPKGLDRINERAASYNMGLSLWINPYSDSYLGYVNYAPFHRMHRDWHVPELEVKLNENGQPYYGGAFKVDSPYSDYVEYQLSQLMTRYDIRQLYWDGADWNIRESEVKGLSQDEREKRKAIGLKRLTDLTDRLHAQRPDLIIVGWNSWADPHFLESLDQQQLSDIHSVPLGLAEVARRQLFYIVSAYMPFNTIWSDWYGLTYKERRDNSNLQLPLSRLKFATLSMISKGIKEAGTGFDLSQGNPELINFLKDTFAFVRQYDRYFDRYQRLLGRPDLSRVDASAHIRDGKGFIVVNNPTNAPQNINIGLNPFTLGLWLGYNYTLYDWSDVTQGRAYGTLQMPSSGSSANLSVSLPPLTTKIIGLDIGDPISPNARSIKQKTLSNDLYLPNPSFFEVWYKGDASLYLQGSADRGWLWGPKPLNSKVEPYQEASGGSRLVQYFDKARMEINNPDGDRSNLYYVTNGLLPKELISGRLQLGDNKYQTLKPSTESVAGDSGSGVSYAALRGVTSLSAGENTAPNRIGAPVTTYLNRAGQLNERKDLSMPEVQLSDYIADTGHNIPNVFTEYFKRLPQDWVFMMGYPISEPYLTEVLLEGKPTLVLLQVFERRVLTYTPGNPESFRVEQGNVGAHYYSWRYGKATSNLTVSLALPCPHANRWRI